MNLKHTFILSLFFLLNLSTAKAALIQTLDESRVFEVTGEYVLETDEDQGQVFIRLPNFSETSLKPISLTLTTEKGRTQDLRLIPKDQAAEALILKPLEENQKGTLKEKSVSRDEVENLLE